VSRLTGPGSPVRKGGEEVTDDTNAAMSLCAAYPGVVHGDVVARWRRHGGQASMERSHLDNRGVAWEIVRQRRESIGRLVALGADGRTRQEAAVYREWTPGSRSANAC